MDMIGGAKILSDRFERDRVKENALLLADHHRAHCEPGCTVSLVALAELLHLAGYELSGDEIRRLV